MGGSAADAAAQLSTERPEQSCICAIPSKPGLWGLMRAARRVKRLKRVVVTRRSVVWIPSQRLHRKRGRVNSTIRSLDLGQVNLMGDMQ